MDFLKSCKTNVHLVEGLSKTSFAIFSGDNELQEYRKRLLALVADLRQRGTLCAPVHDEIYVFGQLTATQTRLMEDGELKFKGTEGQTLETAMHTQAADGRAIKDVLFEAIESSITFRLSYDCGLSHVGPWTWLFRDAEQADQNRESTMLLRLQLKLSDSGALYATVVTESSKLKAWNAYIKQGGNQDTILAPSGQRARTLAQCDKTTAASADWKASVAKNLEAAGLELKVDCDWLPVRLASNYGQTSFVWPLHLCLTEDSPGSRDNLDVDSKPNWMTWFAAPDEMEGFRNPLVEAEKWFTGAPAREMAVAEAAATRMASDEVPAPAAMDLNSPAITSPSFAQRNMDQQAAMSGIYPTPPDGLVPGSQQPTSDSVTAVAQTEQSSLGNELMPQADDAQTRGVTSSSDTPAFQNHADDLFGDVGTMDFGGDEVGDADFDFFNEQEEEDASGQHDESALVGGSRETEAAEQYGVHRSEQAEHVESDQPLETDALAMETSQSVADTSFDDSPDVQTRQHEPEGNTYSSASDQHTLFRPPEKPLSPFTIKERLLPPPIPASTVQLNDGGSLKHRRSSTFEPVIFNEGLHLERKYSSQYVASNAPTEDNTYGTSISLPPKHKKPRLRRPADRDSGSSDENTESEEDSYESASSISEDDLPPKLPWSTNKRKRGVHDAVPPLTGSFERMWNEANAENPAFDHPSDVQMQALLDRLLAPKNKAETGGTVAVIDSSSAGDSLPHEAKLETSDAKQRLLSVGELFKLGKIDLVYIAQLVSEQAVSCIPCISRTRDECVVNFDDSAFTSSAVERLADVALKHILPSADTCDVTQLAMLREPANRNMSTPTNPRPGQPRPPQRSDTANLGPDVVPIPPPFARVKRGQDVYEMLPPALDFWEPLGLAPSNCSKDIRAFAVCPMNEELQKLVDGFLNELGTAYENCRLGSHVYVRNVQDDNDLDDYEDGIAPVELSDDMTLEAALCAYSSTCLELGAFLSSIGQAESNRTIVVYVVDPFPAATKASQYLCACFWQLYKAYRDNIPKAQRNKAYSDIVLQIVPIDLIASTKTLVTLDVHQLGAIAKEVYDRCPPSTSDEGDMTSALPKFSGPFVELASPPPKRIGFQLTAEPPSDLLHEGSVLHLAYALSADGDWMTAAWTDNTGRYHSSASLCLCGKSFAEVAEDVWERTMEIMAAREVTWRVFIVTIGELDDSVKACWRKIVEQPRKQAFSITLMSAQLDPTLKLSPPAAAVEDTSQNNATSSAGFFTPATTPQGTAMTMSPDTTGHNAPPTPAPSDSATAIAENDPDAHLIDLSDESWGVLFSPTFAATFPSCGIANGALFKRGEAGSPEPGSGAVAKPAYAQLPCMMLSLLWTVQVRPNGHVDEGNVKQAEMMLREILRLYRNLSVLTKARGLHDGEAGAVVPVHLAGALKGAAGLDGFLS